MERPHTSRYCPPTAPTLAGGDGSRPRTRTPGAPQLSVWPREAPVRPASGPGRATTAQRPRPARWSLTRAASGSAGRGARHSATLGRLAWRSRAPGAPRPGPGFAASRPPTGGWPPAGWPPSACRCGCAARGGHALHRLGHAPGLGRPAGHGAGRYNGERPVPQRVGRPRSGGPPHRTRQRPRALRRRARPLPRVFMPGVGARLRRGRSDRPVGRAAPGAGGLCRQPQRPRRLPGRERAGLWRPRIGHVYLHSRCGAGASSLPSHPPRGGPLPISGRAPGLPAGPPVATPSRAA